MNHKKKTEKPGEKPHSPKKEKEKPEEMDKHPGWPDIDFKKTLGCGG